MNRILCCARTDFRADRWRRAAVALVAGTAAAVLPHLFGGFKLEVLARLSAVFVGSITGSSVVTQAGGFALPTASVPIVVTTACSAADFCVIVAVLFGWHFAVSRRPAWLIVLTASAAAILTAILINGLRIAALAQAHRWVIPHFPATYAAFLHLLVGVAVFLPALVALNLFLEYHGYRRLTRAR